MTRERSITKLELTRAWVSGKPGRVHARWERADGSHGDVVAYVRLKTAERWYIAQLLVDEPTSALLRDVPLARIQSAIESAIKSDPEMREWIASGVSTETIERASRAAAKRPRLKRPARRRLDDGFYKLVADAYRGAVAHGLPPVRTLAQESDTPPGTVNRWIARARELRYLPEGESGRVTV
jgi:hypothetical protein